LTPTARVYSCLDPNIVTEQTLKINLIIAVDVGYSYQITRHRELI